MNYQEDKEEREDDERDRQLKEDDNYYDQSKANRSFAHVRQQQDDYNDRRVAQHKRDEDDQLDRAKNDPRRLDWLLSGNPSNERLKRIMKRCGGRRAGIDIAMRSEQRIRKEQGLSYTDSKGTMYSADGKRSIFDDVDQ